MRISSTGEVWFAVEVGVLVEDSSVSFGCFFFLVGPRDAWAFARAPKEMFPREVWMSLSSLLFS